MSGMQTRVHVQDGVMTVSNTQDCTPTAEWCKARHNEGLHGTGEMRHAARFDMVLIEKYMNEHGITFAEWLGDKVHARRMLADPALAHFRIWKGRVT